MSKIIQGIISIYFWIILVGLGFLVCVIGIVLNFVSRYIHHIKDLDIFLHRIACLWGKTIFFLMPYWSIKIQGRQYLPSEDEGVVLISNHESLTDIIALFNLNVGFRWMAKAELFRFIFLGQLMRYANYIPVQRGNKESIKQAMDSSRQVLDRKISMMIFPEGTRSKTHTLSPFKNGAFTMALEKGVDIVPMVLKGTCDLVTKGSWMVGRAKVSIDILGRIKYDPNISMEELKEKAFNMMSQAL